MRLILASSSPRRRELLAQAGFIFDVAAATRDEVETDSLALRELTLLNATRKARDVAARNRDAVVIGADTLVALDGHVFSKPTDLDDARRMLRRLSARTHQVCTSVAVIRDSRLGTRSVVSDVAFRQLDDALIDAYFARINPLDKAGGYAAQGEGQMIIEKIDGSYTNVVGLPIIELSELLADFHVYPRR